MNEVGGIYNGLVRVVENKEIKAKLPRYRMTVV
jgi:hypothetical protein